jgi:ribosomal protein L37AE/L43A
MPHDAEPTLVQPTRCPFCDSRAVTATNQKVTASTYWRCETCGQVWHPGRLLTTAVVRQGRR